MKQKKIPETRALDVGKNVVGFDVIARKVTPKEKLDLERKLIPSLSVSLSLFDHKMKWDCCISDIIGSWSWGQSRDWRGAIWDRKLLPFLRNKEKMTWCEIYRETTNGDKRFKSYDINRICKEASARLTDINLDDMTKIYRFRLTNKERFFGFLLHHVFLALWWDPVHKVYPTSVQDRGKTRKKSIRRR